MEDVQRLLFMSTPFGNPENGEERGRSFQQRLAVHLRAAVPKDSTSIPSGEQKTNGFWTGGDRDGLEQLPRTRDMSMDGNSINQIESAFEMLVADWLEQCCEFGTGRTECHRVW